MEKDNLQPSSEKDIKVSEKVQRLTGEESTNKPDTNIPHPEKIKCYMCKEYKYPYEFSRSKIYKRGYDHRCKKCNRERAKKYHEDNKDKILAKWREERNNATKEQKLKKSIKHKEWYWKNIKQRILWRTADRAKRTGIEFNITIDDIIIPEICPLLEVPFIRGGKHDKWYTYSLDRIDNSKGYVKGNIQVITYLANTMKSQASKKELLTFAKNILKNLQDDDIV